MSDTPIVALRRVTKTYRMGDSVFDALHEVDFEVHHGEYVAIMGPSGCGKSTLLNVLGCLDKPTVGHYLLGGKDVSSFDDDALSEIRGAQLGFIFQSYNLIQQLTVLENIEVPLYYQGIGAGAGRRKAKELAERVGLGNRLHHKPSELSGGQQQRVGIARALVNEPLVLLADEPTGNLDSSSGAEILELFDELRRQQKTIIMVTHDPDIGERAGRIIRLRDGKIEEDVRNGLS
ncbi:MAG TPA: ABC transporter ATP-binding protein [Candidatus Hydrogenedentes bacterium]|nr:ABC transporter ATP-binding protein [Candidatus Hydrogenedentota bacterium]